MGKGQVWPQDQKCHGSWRWSQLGNLHSQPCPRPSPLLTVLRPPLATKNGWEIQILQSGHSEGKALAQGHTVKPG